MVYTTETRSTFDIQRTVHRDFFVFSCGAATQRGSWPPHSWGFLDHTQRRTTVGRIPLDEWSARRRDLYLTTHNTHNRQTSMPPVGLEPTISAGERPQTYSLDRAATGTGTFTTTTTTTTTTTNNNNNNNNIFLPLLILVFSTFMFQPWVCPSISHTYYIFFPYYPL